MVWYSQRVEKEEYIFLNYRKNCIKWKTQHNELQYDIESSFTRYRQSRDKIQYYWSDLSVVRCVNPVWNKLRVLATDWLFL